MSGLWPPCRGLCYSLRPQACAPRMVRPRRDRVPEVVDRLDRRLHGTSRDDVIVEGAAVVGDPHRPIHALFHQHMGGPDMVVNLVERPLMRDGEVLSQASCRLETQDAIQIPSRETRPMQIDGLRRRDREALVVLWQIGVQELIRFVDRRYPGQPHLLDHPILEGVKQPLSKKRVRSCNRTL